MAKVTEGGEIFILVLGTGLRLGELLALTWEDADLDQNMLSVNKTLIRVKEYGNKQFKGYLKATSPKTKSSVRTIALLPPLLKC